ncbi:hypothetical protein [Hymenobacter actinosclerus]|uniref:hypothetical protein n=1 Tax=Hymenobacter actinosclerus TaxID=82805 RepID=UPI000B815EB8|nr:hypothetical protein [Hymenobacter actinosclerus]
MREFNWQKAYPDLRLLDETDSFLLGHTYEDALLIRKRNGEHVIEDDFYGDPTCGYISRQDDWAVVAGEHVTTWHSKRGKQIVRFENHQWVQALRYIENACIQLLVDSFGKHGAIWELDVQRNSLRRIREFQDYREQPFTEDIIW